MFLGLLYDCFPFLFTFFIFSFFVCVFQILALVWFTSSSQFSYELLNYLTISYDMLFIRLWVFKLSYGFLNCPMIVYGFALFCVRLCIARYVWMIVYGSAWLHMAFACVCMCVVRLVASSSSSALRARHCGCKLIHTGTDNAQERDIIPDSRSCGLLLRIAVRMWQRRVVIQEPCFVDQQMREVAAFECNGSARPPGRSPSSTEECLPGRLASS